VSGAVSFASFYWLIPIQFFRFYFAILWVQPNWTNCLAFILNALNSKTIVEQKAMSDERPPIGGDAPPTGEEKPAGTVSRLGEPGPKPNADVTVVMARQTHPPPVQVGDVLGHTYRIEALLGRGGMGAVYRARHLVLGSEHAIKVILPEFSTDAKIIALLSQEAQALRSVKNEAVTEYQGLLLDEHGRRYLVMEFVDGPSLASVLKDRRFSPREVRTLRDRLAQGLAAAHAQGIFHRDVSPDNVILQGGRPESAKIIDFGIAKSIESGDRTLIGGDFAGKYSYASPEQAGMFGGRIDARSDIYSLGLVLATAAIGSGGKLDMGNSPGSVFAARQSVPELSRIPEELRGEISGMLQPDPADRPQTMDDLVRPNPGNAASAIRKTAATSEPRSSAQDGGRRWAIAAIAAVAVAMVGGGGWYELFYRTDQQVSQTVAPQTEPGERFAEGSPARVPQEREPPPLSPPPTNETSLPGGLPAPRPEPVHADETLSPKPAQEPATQIAMTPPPLTAQRSEIEALATQAIQGYDCASLTSSVTDAADVKLDGFVSSAKDLARINQAVTGIPGVQHLASTVAVFRWPHCEVAYLLRSRAAVVNDASGPRLRFNVPSLVYKDGDTLVVHVSATTRFAGYLYLDYLDAEGNVVHMLPTKLRPNNSVKPGQEVVVGEGGRAGERIYEIGEPFGPGLVIAISSARPLMPQRATEQESAKDYLPVLARALEASANGAPAHPVVGAYTLINTLPN
jgi:serine/threonine protein kinase